MNKIERIKLIEKLNREVADLLGRRCKTVIPEVDWSARKTYGQYNYSTKVLKISKYMTDDEQIKNTILHELCHAYDMDRSGHGASWRKIAKIVGDYYNSPIYRTSSKEMESEVLSTAVALVHCPKCNKDYYIYRRGRVYQLQAQGCRCRCGCSSLEFIKYR